MANDDRQDSGIRSRRPPVPSVPTDPNLPAPLGIRGISGQLVKAKQVTPEQLDSVSEHMRRAGTTLSKALVEMGVMTARALAEFLAQQHGVEFFELSDFGRPEESALHAFDQRFCQEHGFVPLFFDESDLVVAVADPTNIKLIDDLRFSSGRNVKIVVAPEDAIERAIAKFYGMVSDDKLFRSFGESGAVDVEAEIEVAPRRTPVVDVGDLERSAEAEPVVKLVYILLLSAIKRGASDIHIEPYDCELRVRFRIDGEMHEVLRPPWKLRNAIVSRVKVMCELDISERRLPQDGGMRFKFTNGKTCDFRVNVTPFQHGEKVVIRLLDKANLRADLGSLGFEAAELALFQKTVALPWGMILVTGPTGSGKTTTLYSALSKLNDGKRNISTVEEPVEYDIPGVNQLSVNSLIGLSFAQALRSLLRQDPDVILVGEVRDYETADVAFQAAQTGHLVFSTLHTNDAPSTITRLINMGVDAFRISASLRLIVAQRLVRRTCQSCRQTHAYDQSDCLALGMTEEIYASATLMRGAGCRECNATGFRGRMAVYEMMPITPAIREAIDRGESTADLRRHAVRGGMRTIAQSAIDKFAHGLTTYEEVLRVMGDREV